LLLDEPTHHLDLAGKEVLENASVVRTGRGRRGDARPLADGRRSRPASSRSTAAACGCIQGATTTTRPARLARTSGSAPVEPAPARARLRVSFEACPFEAAGRGQGRRAARQKKEKETVRLEKDIEVREAELKEVEAKLADPDVYADGARSKDLVKRYEALKAELESLWEQLGELA
jgi:ATP-binding cassette subfamily F protein 3